MKKLVLAATLAGAASMAQAGNYSDPVIEMPPMIEEASSSSSGIVVPLVILALALVAVSN
jgi:hypothetical protein